MQKIEKLLQKRAAELLAAQTNATSSFIMSSALLISANI